MSKVVPVTPEYWAEACAHLSRKDRVMKKIIPQFGDAILESRGDAFVTLARSIAVSYTHLTLPTICSV